MAGKYVLIAFVATLILYPLNYTYAQIKSYTDNKPYVVESLSDIQAHLDSGYMPVIQLQRDSTIVFIRYEWKYQAIMGRFNSDVKLNKFLDSKGREGWKLVDIMLEYAPEWQTSVFAMQEIDFVTSLGDTINEYQPQYKIKPWQNYIMIFVKPQIKLAPQINSYRQMVAEGTWPPSEEPEEPIDDRININNAPADILQTLPGIGPTLSARIVDYRTANGPFQSIEDIKLVRGIGDSWFNTNGHLITTGN